MISLEDCIALCGLTEDEVLAIAEHEHIPEIVAASLGRYLLNTDHGAEQIRDMIRDDIRLSLDRKDTAHASMLIQVLRQYTAAHPELRQPTA